jgi:hypothetical protein
MKTYSITYDLGNPNRDYEGVFEQIKKLASGYCRPTKSHWLINSNSTPGEIRTAITAKMDAGDKLIVSEVGNLWATWGLDKATTDWLHAYWQSSCGVS